MNYYTYVQHVDVDHRHRLTRMLVCGSGRLAEAEAETEVYLVLGWRGHRLEPGVLLVAENPLGNIVLSPDRKAMIAIHLRCLHPVF